MRLFFSIHRQFKEPSGVLKTRVTQPFNRRKIKNESHATFFIYQGMNFRIKSAKVNNDPLRNDPLEVMAPLLSSS